MPHDKDGNPLAVGDKVTIECVVKIVSPGEDYCNLTVETCEPMKPGTTPTLITLNAGQVVKAGLVALALALFPGTAAAQCASGSCGVGGMRSARVAWRTPTMLPMAPTATFAQTARLATIYRPSGVAYHPVATVYQTRSQRRFRSFR